MSTKPQNNKIPSLYEWMGGMEVFEKLMVVFYKKVLEDPLLVSVFGHMSPDHQRHVAHFVAEGFGAPSIYSEPGGSHARVVLKHVGQHPTEEQRPQRGRLLLDCADTSTGPCETELRSALCAFI